MLIRTGGKVGYFSATWSTLGFNFAADIFVKFLNINKLSAWRLATQLYRLGLLRSGSCTVETWKNDVKLVCRNGVVIQSFGERGDLFIRFNFCLTFLAADYQPWRNEIHKKECSRCRKLVSKITLYKHTKNECVLSKMPCPKCGKCCKKNSRKAPYIQALHV